MMVQQAGPNLARGATAVAILAVVVVVAGGIVRVSGAGLGCPDWPLCYGQVVPPVVGPAVIEFTHRAVAGLFSLGVAWLGWAGWRQRRHGGGPRTTVVARQVLAWTGLGSVALVLVQVVLGGLNVLTELSPEVGATHVAVAMGLVGLLAASAQLARLIEGPQPPPGSARREERLRRLRWAVWSAGLAFLVVALGGYMRATGASLACYDWPLCRGRLLPEPAWPVVLHWSHRAAALALGIVLAVGSLRVGGLLWWALGLYTAQAASGALGVWWGLPAALRVVHLGLAAGVMAALGAELARSAVQAWSVDRPMGRVGPTACGAPERLRPA